MYRDSRQVDVLLFIEHKDRELEVACAIGQILKIKYNLTVAIASTIFHLMVAALTVRPKVVVTPGQGFGKGSATSIFHYIYGDSIIFCNLNMEQFLSSLSRHVTIPNDRFKRKVIKHFCWGERYRQFLIENGVDPENVMITGKPAVSIMLKKEKDSGYALKEKISKTFELSVGDKWLFFPTSCGMVFSSDYHMKTRITSGWNPEMAWAYRGYMSSLLDKEFLWLAKLPENGIDGCLTILRPHPSVSVEQYTERFIQVVGYIPSHVHISKELTAQDWLIASDACYVTLSTVSVDAEIIGKPVYRLEPIPFPTFMEEEDWFTELPRLTSFEELLLSIQNLSQYHIENKRALFDYIDLNLDGIEETSRFLARFAKSGESGSMSTSGLLKAVLSSPRRTIGSMVRFLLTISGMDIPYILQDGLKRDYFDAHEVVKQMEAVSKC